MAKSIDDQIAELSAQIAALSNQSTARPQGPIPAPHALTNPMGPATRAAALEAYSAACMDVPTGQWSKEMADAVREQCKAVLARGW